MTKTTWREEFDTKFSQIAESMPIMSKGDHGDGHAIDNGSYGIMSYYDLEDVKDFIQQQINKAEERGQEKMKGKCKKTLRAIDEYGYFDTAINVISNIPTNE